MIIGRHYEQRYEVFNEISNFKLNIREVSQLSILNQKLVLG